jgi:pyruvate formate lyase activating enzyme
MTGRIFDIKRFAVHDGPGIRTTAFLKGCPLRCLWCQNPEGIDGGRDLWVKREKCLRCGACVELCREGALSLGEGNIRINRGACTFCGACMGRCPTGAIQRIDREISPEELAEELALDRVFFDVSGGGVTLSGGEPLAQSEFAFALLEKLKVMGIHTCMETSLFAPEAVIRRLPEFLDCLICDIKIFDEEDHRRYVGESNRLILENFRLAAAAFPRVLVRIPLIPDITATEKNLRAVGNFVRSCLPDAGIELLNYNWFSESKYTLLDKPHFNAGARSFQDEDLSRFYSWAAPRPARGGSHVDRS